MQVRMMIGLLARLIVSGLVALPFLWASQVMETAPGWAMAVQGLVVLSALLPLVGNLRWRWLVALGLLILPFLLGPLPPTALLVLYLLTGVLLIGLAQLYSQPGAAARLGLIAASLLISLLLLNLGAGFILNGLEASAAATAPSPAPTEAAAAITATESPTEAPTSTPESDATPEPTATPEPARPVAWSAHIDWLQDGGEPDYVNLTGSAPRINSVGHAYEYDENGALVYDHQVRFNSQGWRGEAVPYDKPDDVYRILIIGDSFVEGVQVDYPQTFGALLQDKLAQQDTANKRYEVVSVGRTGWGTLQELIYYQVEGYRYNADLVILSFYINDVADNYPRVFYPNINNTNFDYVFEDDSVKLIDTNQQPLPPNVPRKLYNALPPMLQQSNTARLLIRLFDPPVPVLTPGGVLTRVHPQWYIYVTSPEMEGYPEAWARTARGCIFSRKNVTANGARFAVMPIFVGKEMVQNISGWFPEITAGWQWDDGLPEKRLSTILADSPADSDPHPARLRSLRGGPRRPGLRSALSARRRALQHDRPRGHGPGAV